MPINEGNRTGYVYVTRNLLILSLLGSVFLTTGCSTISTPKIDLPEFRETAANVDELEYPNPNQAPEAPENLPTAEEWDKAAKKIIQYRDNFDAPPDYDADLTEEQMIKEIEALKKQVKEYQKDDPDVF